MDKLLYGVAYYDEYMPYERLEKDMEMMKAANINVIRIAESTWASEEPEDGVFDFTHVERALEASQKAGLSVIVGTPTYAIPPWLAAKHPEILAVTPRGKGKYGARQNMDITSPIYRFHAERVIRKLMECVQKYPHVIGFQLDNETKHYNTCGPNVQKMFAKYLRDKFGTVEAMNEAYGFNYWSNRVDSWENLPDPTGSINWSYVGEFSKFQRSLVDEYLAWQAKIVREYAREDQFITHNFDYEWRGYSYGVQPDVNHKLAAKCLTVAGCDIYHPTQDKLTGKEIAMGGALCRNLKQDNYLVIETEAQGHANWTPYDGQLRLHAFSHVASGANAVMYWHWHSIHNSFETYWKGLLSHDLQPNAPYREACTIGADFARLSHKLVNLKKKNRVGMLVSNEALTALSLWRFNYNDVMRWMFDTLYEMNIECDMLFPQDENFEDYDVLVVPALYSAPRELLERIRDFVKNGGELVTTFRTGFTDDNQKVYPEVQPAVLQDCLGIAYDEFTIPENVGIQSHVLSIPADQQQASLWMELVRAEDADVLAYYDHKFWGKYAAITENAFGEGHATYLATMTSAAALKAVFERVLKRAGVWGVEQQTKFPMIIKNAVNMDGKTVHFYFNYSRDDVEQVYLHADGVELISSDSVQNGDIMTFEPWGFKVIEEK
ncbi:MAG: beta-galactosidase [Clostridia bacterium]|nr:beta-galactosidase [Clostridia bacterium]